jgi:uroporphyrinogen decarboxylase
MTKESYTGKERMAAAFEGRKLDRTPVMLMLAGHYAEKAGYTLDAYLTQPEAALRTIKLTSDEVETDALVAPFNPLLPDAQEAIRKRYGKVPSIKKDNIKEILPKWVVRQPREDRHFSAHLDVCEKAVAMIPHILLYTMIGGPWSFAAQLRGIEEAMEDIYDDKPFLHDLMKWTTETVTLRCLAVLELGVMPFIGDPSAGMSLISPKIYREFVMPSHAQIVQAVHEKAGRIGFHICGYVDPIMEDLVALGIDALSIDHPSSLEQMFEVGRGKVTIIGNIDPVMFLEGTPAQLEEAVKTCMAISNGDPKYVIGPGCRIPLEADKDNIKHFTACCHRYGAF